MANEIRLKNIAGANFTITLADGTAGLASGSARASASVDNSLTDYPGAWISLRITSGATAPTAGALYEVYLLQHNGTIGTDGWVGTNAPITIQNAPLIGTITVTATAATAFFAVKLDTAVSGGGLGTTWGIAIKNASGQAISATAADHIASYEYYVPEVQ